MKTILISAFLFFSILLNAQAPNITICASQEGAIVNFSSQSNILISQQAPGNYEVSYYLSFSNANSGIGAISSTNYLAQMTTLIYARVKNLALSEVTISTFMLFVEESPQISAQPDILVCEDYTLPPLTVGNYFTSSGGNGVQLSTGTLITSSQTIYIFAQSGNCSAENSFQIIVNPLPQVELQDGIICISENGFLYNPYLLNSNLNASQYLFQWELNGELISGASESTYLATVSGIYTVIVSDLSQQCFASAEATITAFNPLTEATASFSGTTLEVDVVNPDEYQFSLDGQPLQNSAVFFNVPAGIHEIAVCAKNGCGKFIFMIDNSLSVGKNIFAEFIYYPNPVTSILNFSASEAIEKIEVSNLLGQIVLSKNLYGSKQIDLSGFENGIYNVRIASAEKQRIFKIVKN